MSRRLWQGWWAIVAICFLGLLYVADRIATALIQRARAAVAR
jgi:hypothetical protein